MSTVSESAARSGWSAGLEPLLARLDDDGPAIVARTESWSALNSGSYELAGLARMRAELLGAFAALPGKIEEVALAPSQRVRPDGAIGQIEHGASIRIRVRPDAPIQAAFTGHYDTVFPAAHPFQKPWRDGELLHGPGVADMKGGLSVMLTALEAFERLPGEKRLGYEVLLSPDEEVGSPASAPLLAELGARAHFGMTYEPAMSDGALVDARKGSANYSLIVTGKAAHVGRAFDEGRNAVIAAADAALALDALNAARLGVTFNTGSIDGGSAVNVVPERAVLRFNVRAPDAESAAWAEKEVKRIAKATDEREGFSAQLHGGFTRAPKPLNAQQTAMKQWMREAGAVLGLDLQFRASGGVCEGNNLAAAGCPNIDTLGPCGGGLHSDQEFALIPSFAERAKLSFLMLAAVERGAFDVKESALVSISDYVTRAAGPQDLEGFKELREIAGPGFTSLMLDDKALAEKLQLSAQSFAANVNTPGPERYFIALEHIPSGALVGCAGVKATIGKTPPFFNFRIITEAQSSAVVKQRFDMDVLIGVNDFTGCTEVGSLFVRPEHRAGGIGRALAQSRYMLMAAAPQRFNSRVVSELRGVVSPDGVSPFWESVGRHFFRMDFAEADKLSATTDNQFILDLTPQHPIYINLLPQSARDVIGQCHKDGEGARRLLEWEGFSFSNVVDIFDGGPLLTVQRDHIRTRREARLAAVRVNPNLKDGKRALIAAPHISGFRCMAARAENVNGVVEIEPAILSALRLNDGDQALIWVSDAD